MDQYLKKEQLQAQIEFLGGQMPARITLDNWFRADALPRPSSPGGRGNERQYHPATAAELHAGMALILAGGGKVSKAQIRGIRGLALLIEGCYSPQEVLEVARGWTRGAQGQDITAMGPDIVFWLRQKRKSMRALYAKTQPAVEKRRDEYFDSDNFVRLVLGMTNGFFDGYRFEGNRLIAPEKKMVPEAEALKNFPKAKAA